jgi:hypothetical protein
MTRDVVLLRLHRAVQALVEQQVRSLADIHPGREGPRRGPVPGGFLLVVHVDPRLAAAGLAVAAEQLLELAEQVRVGPEVAEVLVARPPRLGHLLAHLGAVVAVEGVALDDGRIDLLATEDPLEGGLDRRRPGAGGAGDGDDRVLGRHGASSAVRY